jgi:anthranilate/para-aminobenzoate synthase component I
VASVCGRLSPGVSPWAALAALFPGGSITGAPKIRAMEIIAELEDVPRGVYTGSIGYVGPGGLCEWNIAIRTIQQHGGLAHLHVGGGIVADSDPQAEYDETLDKARGLLESAAMATNASPGPIGR